jgi:hypothetical protein
MMSKEYFWQAYNISYLFNNDLPRFKFLITGIVAPGLGMALSLPDVTQIIEIPEIVEVQGPTLLKVE